MKFAAAVFFTLFLAVSVSAQISMRIELNQDAFLQYEPIFVRVFVRNMTGHLIAFGERPGLKGTLKFDIYPGGRNAQRLPFRKPDTQNMNEKQKALASILPDMHGVILPAGSVQEYTFRLSDYYDMRNIGSYNIKAVISHDQIGSAYQSNTVQCKVTEGMKIWGPVTVGLPDSGTEDPPLAGLEKTKIKTRNYSIVSYFTGKVTAYALIIDDKEHIYFVRRIGFDLGSNLRPQCAIDFLSRLNILVAASPKVFAYYQFNTDGNLERKQVYIKTTSAPTLVLDKKTGIVMPAGGRIANRDVDYEEIKDLPFTEDVFGDRRRSAPLPDDDEDDLPVAPPARGTSSSTAVR